MRYRRHCTAGMTAADRAAAGMEALAVDSGAEGLAVVVRAGGLETVAAAAEDLEEVARAAGWEAAVRAVALVAPTVACMGTGT